MSQHSILSSRSIERAQKGLNIDSSYANFMTDLEKKDIYGDKERYLKFKEESSEFGITDISKINSNLILNHLESVTF